jgi:hypothetical protein
MLTLLMQCLVAILTIVFGIVALQAARRVPGRSDLHRDAWWLTGAVFTILGISTFLQLCIGAPWAYFSGVGTPVYDAYIRVAPIGNHSRGFLVLAYGAMMAGLTLIRRAFPRHFGTLVFVTSFAAMSAGAFVGWREGPLVQVTHWTATAISDSAELIFLLAALFIGVVWNTTDRLLWVALVIFTAHELFDVAWYSALAWSDVPGAWRPSPTYIHLYASVAYLLMIVLAVRRVRLARKGIKVPGLIELPERATSSMFG